MVTQMIISVTFTSMTALRLLNYGRDVVGNLHLAGLGELSPQVAPLHLAGQECPRAMGALGWAIRDLPADHGGLSRMRLLLALLASWSESWASGSGFRQPNELRLCYPDGSAVRCSRYKGQ